MGIYYLIIVCIGKGHIVISFTFIVVHASLKLALFFHAKFIFCNLSLFRINMRNFIFTSYSMMHPLTRPPQANNLCRQFSTSVEKREDMEGMEIKGLMDECHHKPAELVSEVAAAAKAAPKWREQQRRREKRIGISVDLTQV